MLKARIVSKLHNEEDIILIAEVTGEGISLPVSELDFGGGVVLNKENVTELLALLGGD